MTASERGYLSIGEVLALLQEEFPDVTISKIRFLESQGLIEPERTPSGYRKFYGTDVERLRFILREQRENYLPLRVIRDRLDAGPDGDGGEFDDEGAPAGAATADTASGSDAAVRADAPEPAAAEAPAPSSVPAPIEPAPETEHVPVWLRKAPPGVTRIGDRDRLTHPSAALPTTPAPLQLVASLPAEPAEPEPATSVPAPSVPAAAVPAAAVEPAGPDEVVQLTIDELATQAGVDVAEIRDLEKFGLIAARAVGRTAYYDGDAVRMARLAAGFLRHGIEPRHLRMYKQAVERESALFEQVVAPLARQRNPKARAQAADALRELADHGAALRALLVTQALRDLQP